jgi:hypothetical protein
MELRARLATTFIDGANRFLASEKFTGFADFEDTEAISVQ